MEAARAGEQGRGFAVVASEVRALAGRSAEAAKEIKTLIDTSVQRVGHGTQLADQAGQSMQEMINAIGRVTDIMAEISAASREQSQSVSQVGDAVAQMDQTTQQNAALVEEMAAAAASLRQQAADYEGSDPLLHALRLQQAQQLAGRILDAYEASGKLSARLSRFIDKLPDAQEREVLKLCYLSGLNTYQIGEILGYSERHVYRIRHRALMHLEGLRR